MNFRHVIDQFRADPSGFKRLGEGHKMMLGDEPSSTVFQVPDLPVVLKVYGPHENKPEPLERARHEYDMLMRVIDLPGTPKTAQLIIVEGKPYLIRESGDLPDGWTSERIFQVQDTIEALWQRGILLHDVAQVAVREDGSAFIYDLESARTHDPTDSQANLRLRHEQADDSFWQWLRDEGYPERHLRSYMEAKIAVLESLQEHGLLDYSGSVARYRDLLAREDRVKAQLEAREFTSEGYLFSLADWQKTVRSLTGRLDTCCYRMTRLSAAWSEGGLSTSQYEEGWRVQRSKEVTLECQLARAKGWVAILESEECDSEPGVADEAASEAN